jgi:hypothetical protein
MHENKNKAERGIETTKTTPMMEKKSRYMLFTQLNEIIAMRCEF